MGKSQQFLETGWYMRVQMFWGKGHEIVQKINTWSEETKVGLLDLDIVSAGNGWFACSILHDGVVGERPFKCRQFVAFGIHRVAEIQEESATWIESQRPRQLLRVRMLTDGQDPTCLLFYVP